MENTHSVKHRKSLEKPGFLGIPGKFSSLRPSDRGRIGIFYAFKMPKTHWR
jgi:hypothetical protein